MKSGILKQIFIEHKLTKIQVSFEDNKNSADFTVIDARFDIITRNIIFLDVSANPHSRYNKTQSIKAFMMDFKDSHDIVVIDKDHEDIAYFLSGEYEINNNVAILKIVKEAKLNQNGLKRYYRK